MTTVSLTASTTSGAVSRRDEYIRADDGLECLDDFGGGGGGCWADGESAKGFEGGLRWWCRTAAMEIHTDPADPQDMSSWSRDDVAARILAGDLLIVYSGHLLRIPDAWLDAHPAGPLAILHFVGRDATDEIQAYHPDDTLALISRYSIGRVHVPSAGWEPLLPPVMSGWVRTLRPDGSRAWFNEARAVRPASHVLLVQTDNNQPAQAAPTLDAIEPPPTVLSLDIQTAHSKAYRDLHQRIIDAGLYKTPYLTGYGPEVLRYAFLGSLSAYAYANHWFMSSAVFLGLMWHQLVFTAHDLGHMGVTHNWAIDRLLGIFIADFIGGLSIGWWVDVSVFFFTSYARAHVE